VGGNVVVGRNVVGLKDSEGWKVSVGVKVPVGAEVPGVPFGINTDGSADCVGVAVGVAVSGFVGLTVGDFVGLTVGVLVGLTVGVLVGLTVGVVEGLADAVGASVGGFEGLDVGVGTTGVERPFPFFFDFFEVLVLSVVGGTVGAPSLKLFSTLRLLSLFSFLVVWETTYSSTIVPSCVGIGPGASFADFKCRLFEARASVRMWSAETSDRAKMARTRAKKTSFLVMLMV